MEVKTTEREKDSVDGSSPNGASEASGDPLQRPSAGAISGGRVLEALHLRRPQMDALRKAKRELDAIQEGFWTQQQVLLAALRDMEDESVSLAQLDTALGAARELHANTESRMSASSHFVTGSRFACWIKCKPHGQWWRRRACSMLSPSQTLQSKANKQLTMAGPRSPNRGA